MHACDGAFDLGQVSCVTTEPRFHKLLLGKEPESLFVPALLNGDLLWQKLRATTLNASAVFCKSCSEIPDADGAGKRSMMLVNALSILFFEMSCELRAQFKSCS